MTVNFTRIKLDRNGLDDSVAQVTWFTTLMASICIKLEVCDWSRAI